MDGESAASNVAPVMARPTEHQPQLLRHAVVHAEPRVLALPRRSRPAAAALAVSSPQAGPTPMALPTVQPTPESVYQDARDRGLREGHEAGLRKGLEDAQRRLDEATRAARSAVEAEARRAADQQAAQWQECRQRLDTVIESLAPLLQSHVARLESDAIALAFEVICRVLGSDDSRREVVGAMVTQAFAQLRSQPLRVRLHPADLALLEDGSDLRHRHPHVEWLADARVSAGGCLVDSNAGTLDARLDVQLQRLLQSWRDSGSLSEGAGP